MRISDYISPSLTYVVQGPLRKREFLTYFVDQVHQAYPELDSKILVERLIAREEDVTTGIAHSVAIPHALMECLERPICAVAQIPQGIDFLALDASLVHIAFLLISPPSSTGIHLQLLARIARLVDEEDFIVRMVRAKDQGELFQTIVDEDSKRI